MACFFLLSNLCLGREPSGELPPAIKATLDRRFPGWGFVGVRDEIRHFLRERVSAGARPDLVSGDFDGDRRRDYALLVVHNEEVLLLAFLNRGARYKLYELGEPGEYLTLGKKGTDGFDFHADKKFKYANDAIEVWIFEKAGWAYIYDGGKFRYVYMLD